MQKETEYFARHGFFTKEHGASNQGLSNGFKAVKSGTIKLLFKYTDYFFVYNHNKAVTLEALQTLHGESKKIANLDFKLPKALRLKVPNINTVLITSAEIPLDVLEYVQQKKVSFTGGEQESVFIYNTVTNKLHTSGIQEATLFGGTGSLLGDKMVFKEINGPNRALYFMKSFITEVYNS